MDRRRLLPFVPYALVSAVHVVLLLAGSPLAGPTKLALMPLLAVAVVWALSASAPRPIRRGIAISAGLLLAGILFSWLGDGAAAFFPALPELPMMLLCFGLAHIAYVVLMWRGSGVSRRPLPRWAFVYLLAYIVLVVLLVPHTGALTAPVVVYGLLLAATAASASRCGAVVAWGGAWFLVSDAILAFRIFVPDAMPGWTGGTVMLAYALGQGLIAYGISASLRRAGATSGAARPDRGA